MIEKPIATFQPVFVPWISLLQQVPLQLFFSFWAGGFFGGMFQAVLRPVLGSLGIALTPFVAVGGLVFVAFPFVVLVSRALNYHNTIYRLFSDRIEIEEGFLTVHAKRVMFRDVREVSLRRGVLQRTASLGSVYLATQATGTGASWSVLGTFGSSSTFGSGALIRDIVASEETYLSLRERVDQTRRD